MIRCFPEPLDTRRVPYRDGREVALLADFPMVLPIGVEITTKAGFVSDGASIPEFFRRVIGCPFAGAYVWAAIPHDVLYAAEAMDSKWARQVGRRAEEIAFMLRTGQYP